MQMAIHAEARGETARCEHPEDDQRLLADVTGDPLRWCGRCGSLGERWPFGTQQEDWQEPHRGIYVFQGTPAPNTPRDMPIPAAPILSSAVMALVEANKGIFLDVGCSDHKSKDSIGMDIRAVEGVDIVHSLLDIPWPLPDTCCKRILASHILEHLPPDRIFAVMDECWRVMQPQGQLLIAMPYANSARAMQDPSHYRCWNEVCAQYYDPDYGLFQVYWPRPWKIEQHYWDELQDLRIIFAKRTLDEAVQCPYGQRQANGVRP